MTSDDSNTLSETITNILDGGAAATSKTLQEIVKAKGTGQIASAINQYIAENTVHFRNLWGVKQLADGGDSLVSLLPEISSGAVRTGAKYLPSFIGSALDFSFQISDGEAFDWVYDHADDIREGASDLWEGTQNFVGDAVSGVTDSLGSISG